MHVNPSVSVITLTATGLFCYAGHVCNYYCKVLKCFKGLPAVLRDKRWFLIKRRRSVRGCDSETRQKKPTTANRARLERAIDVLFKKMPNVYKDSYRMPDELAKFPDDGEQEMLEQEESVKTDGSVMIPMDTFVRWMDYHEHVVAATGVCKYPCAAVVMQYAKDQQGSDLRGGVAGDSAWEICCRLLLEMDTRHIHSMRSSDLAQLIVFWLEKKLVHSSHRQLIYQGMHEDLKARGRKLMNERDVEEMQIYWLKMRIHQELDVVREDCAARGEELPVELEVELPAPHFGGGARGCLRSVCLTRRGLGGMGC